MNLLMLCLIAVGLAMDAFAVSITSAIAQSRMRVSQALTIAGLFGFFQGIMPIAGFFLGSSFAAYITAYDHYVVFAVLAFVGGKMVYDALRPGEGNPAVSTFLLRTYLVLAVITSIDALSVGLSLAFIQYPILLAAFVIAGITFVICLAGLFLGKKCGDIFHNKAEIVGGIMLILIGTKILLEHLGIL